MSRFESSFQEALYVLCSRSKRECKYIPTRFLQMLSEHGGVKTAKLLLHGAPSEGLTRLWELGRLDLSMEVLVLKEPWSQLFTAEEKNEANKRLTDRGYSHQAVA